jgi:hypothetical protein
VGPEECAELLRLGRVPLGEEVRNTQAALSR